MNKVEVKRLITACQDLSVEQKSRLRSLLDQNVVGVDSMVTSDGTLISTPELLLVITDNTTNSKEVSVAESNYCFFVVSAKIRNSKNRSGIRRKIFNEACRHGAMYDNRMSHPSIWYPEASFDLNISLMFSCKERAIMFINTLLEFNIGENSLLCGALEVSLTPEKFQTMHEGIYVFNHDYNCKDTTSPSNTYDESISMKTLAQPEDRIQALRTVLNVQLFAPCSTIYRCHLASQTFHPRYKNDKDNILYGSALFHDYFDGDGKRLPVDKNESWGNPPQFKIEFISVGEEVLNFKFLDYHKIYVKLTFRNSQCAKFMEPFMREGTEVVDECCMRTFFYGNNPENCAKYLYYKQIETEVRWMEKPASALDELSAL